VKVSEGGGPWLRSENGFHGRQVWEFDPDDAGRHAGGARRSRQLSQDFSRHRFQSELLLIFRVKLEKYLCLAAGKNNFTVI
jgi:hypothetical protein